jgi:RecB family exonuclease
MRLSATRIKTYLTCPRQFRYIYVDKLPKTLTGPLALGRVLHETIRSLHLKSLETGDALDLAFAVAEFDHRWNLLLETDRPFFKEGEATNQKLQALAGDMLVRYVEANRGKPAPLVIEFPFELSVGDHEICGIIDRIDEAADGLILTDFKSGKAKPSARVLNADLQLTIYAFAIEQLFGEAPSRVIYYHLRDQTRLLTLRSHDDFQTLKSGVLPHVTQAIDACLFPPQYGYWCRFCDFQQRCKDEGPTSLYRPRE